MAKMTAVQHYEAGQEALAHAHRNDRHGFSEETMAKSALAQAHFAAAAVALQVEQAGRTAGVSPEWQAAFGFKSKPGF